MVAVGDKAPAFELPDADMDLCPSSRFDGKRYVLYFYPKDDTPGCTLEGQAFSDLLEEFEALNCAVIGVSQDNCVSHGEFRDKYGLTVTLLADVEGQLCDAYEVMQEREKDGVKRQVLVRSTFVVDEQGVIRHAQYDVKPKGHAEQVLEIVKAL